LEKAGVVGIAQGSRPREVLIADENNLNALFIQLKEQGGI
jgi:S-DNA-T family DNA segregation ATPase FtsK/SpoIIIE